MTKVINIKNTKENYEYCGRPSIFGNPFVIGKDGNRNEVISMFKVYFNERIKTDENFKNQVLKLRDKNLGCFCKPLACHCDVLAEYLNNL